LRGKGCRSRFTFAEIRGNLIGAKYGEPFVQKEMMRVDDLLQTGVRSF
jgi:hypothetical protein